MVQGMNRLPLSKRAQLLGLLVEGNSLRAASRLADVSFNAVLKFIGDMGRACASHQDASLRNLQSKRLQVDEIWAFAYCKAKNLPTAKTAPEMAGDIWTWVCLDADTKLAVSWLVSDRSAEAAHEFMQDVAMRAPRRVQLTSDGYRAYQTAVEEAFKGKVDYAQLVKVFGSEGNTSGTGRYSPPQCIGAHKEIISGDPDPAHINTAFAERQNLNMRMSMRRFTRLTNGFSKKAENHAHAVAMHFMYYNFGRIHKTLRVTPAMAAGIADHVWSLEEIAGLDVQVAPAVRGPYKKHAA